MNNPVEHIQIDEDGVPRTINKNVKVKMIASKFLYADESAEDIAEHYGIAVSDVYAALAYYYDNKDEYDERERENMAYVKKHGISTEEHLAQLRARLPKTE